MYCIEPQKSLYLKYFPPSYFESEGGFVEFWDGIFEFQGVDVEKKGGFVEFQGEIFEFQGGLIKKASGVILRPFFAAILAEKLTG